MQTPKIASITCDPYPVPYYHLVNGLHDLHQTWSYLFTGVEGDSHTSPCFVHELSHPNPELRPTEVPFPLCRKEERTHLLVLKAWKGLYVTP